MPLYEFKCQNCGHTDEEYRKIGNFAPVEVCPQCDELEYHKLPSVFHSERDFAQPILCITKPVHTLAEAREIEAKCPDVQVVPDPEDPGTLIPLLRNNRAKQQLYKYKKLVD